MLLKKHISNFSWLLMRCSQPIGNVTRCDHFLILDGVRKRSLKKTLQGAVRLNGDAHQRNLASKKTFERSLFGVAMKKLSLEQQLLNAACLLTTPPKKKWSWEEHGLPSCIGLACCLAWPMFFWHFSWLRVFSALAWLEGSTGDKSEKMLLNT